MMSTSSTANLGNTSQQPGNTTTIIRPSGNMVKLQQPGGMIQSQPPGSQPLQQPLQLQQSAISPQQMPQTVNQIPPQQSNIGSIQQQQHMQQQVSTQQGQNQIKGKLLFSQQFCFHT